MSQHEESQDREYEVGMGSLRQLGSLKSNNAPSTSTKKGLMFVNSSINGKAVRAMLDTGATHNFVSLDEAKKLGLKAISRGGTIKAVNSPAKPIAGIAKADVLQSGSRPCRKLTQHPRWEQDLFGHNGTYCQGGVQGVVRPAIQEGNEDGS
ncbi:hypothetical protein Dsin_017095 [Dipteronia sinensis]|uniref:Uncharacterized protein n=1 Tax=Dipteronia sinensis TaxID=43782 RepID=A0AAE0E683_9ROSI|nr:hypothetical protein Dsin_017095 [Dipteronia sinensis]